MPRWSPSIRAFNGGELSPRVHGRGDLPIFQAGANRLENFIPLPNGPILRRSGTRFVREVKDSAQSVVLIPFNISSTESYVIEMGPLYMRFFTNEGFAVPSGLEISTNYNSEEIHDVQWTQSSDTLYLVHTHHPPMQLVRSTIPSISFTLSEFELLDGPYLPANDTNAGATFNGTSAVDVTPANTDGLGGSETPASVVFYNGAALELTDGRTLDDHVGRHMWFQNVDGYTSDVNTRYATGQFGWGTIVLPRPLSGNAFNMRPYAYSLFDNANGAGVESLRCTNWRAGTYYANNYPSTVAFYQSRLWFAGAPFSPQTIDGSVIGNFARFSPFGSIDDDIDDLAWSEGSNEAPLDNNAVSYTLSSNRQNRILWLLPVRTLLVGTSGSLFQVSGSTSTDPVTPNNVKVTEEEATGSSSVPPISIGESVFFVGRSGRQIYSAGFSIQADGISATDITEFADHMAGTGFKKLEHTAVPYPQIYALTADGQLQICTFSPQAKVVAWGRVILGGKVLGKTIPEVEDVAVVSTETHDQVWLVVKRTINGETKRYIEFLEKPFRVLDDAEEVEDSFFSDCGITWTQIGGGDDPAIISNVENTNPVRVTFSRHGFSTGTQVRITGVVGSSEINGEVYTVTSVVPMEGDYVVSLDGVDGTSWGTYESGGKARKMATTITGLSYLEGQTVSILGDGSPQPSRTIIGGSLTMETAASYIHLGLHAPAVFESLSLETPDPEGVGQGKLKNYDTVNLKLHDTVGGSIGSSDSDLVDMVFRDVGDSVGEPLPTFEGDKRMTFPGGWSRSGRVIIKQEQPLPMTVLSMGFSGKGGQR